MKEQLKSILKIKLMIKEFFKFTKIIFKILSGENYE